MVLITLDRKLIKTLLSKVYLFVMDSLNDRVERPVEVKLIKDSGIINIPYGFYYTR